MKFTLLLLTCFLASIRSVACINVYQTLLSGEVVFTEPVGGQVSERPIDTFALREEASELLEAYQRTDSLEYLSDHAAALTYFGEYESAIQFYQFIEKQSPGLYTTASNLGTLYELTGKPDLALNWIQKSMELNPKSHFGSEWIHVKILEFKLSGLQDSTQSILGLDFGNSKTPSNPHAYNLTVLKAQIWHQLMERTRFVKPQNPIVGNIYFDLGNIIAQTDHVESALESYEAAKKYGFQSELLDVRTKELRRLSLNAKPHQVVEDVKEVVSKNIDALFWTGLVLVLVGILILLWITRKIARKRQSRQ